MLNILKASRNCLFFIFFSFIIAGCDLNSETKQPEEEPKKECILSAVTPSPLREIINSNSIYFVRYDGGELEVNKGLITEWPYLLDPLNQSITANLYREPQRAIDLLHELNSDWIWVTWSNGFSVKTESKQWEELKCFIGEMHNSDINVTAYLSLANIFWEDMFENDPQSKEWLRYDSEGEPVLYGKKSGRYIADLKNVDYQNYLLLRISKALEYGADAIYLDNIIFESYDDVIDILLSIKKLLYEQAKYIPLYVNTRHPEIIKHSDLLLAEGAIEAGYYGEEKGYKNNLSEIKGLRQRVADLDIPIKFEHNSHRGGNRREEVMTSSGYKRSLAEAWAFNTSFYFAPEGVTLTEIVNNTELGRSITQSIGSYTTFRKDNIEYWSYSNVVADSDDSWDIAINSQDEDIDQKVVVTLSENDNYYYVQIVNYDDLPLTCVDIQLDNELFDGAVGDAIYSSPDDTGGNSELSCDSKVYEDGVLLVLDRVTHYSTVAIPKLKL